MDESLRELLLAAEAGDRAAFAEFERLHVRLSPEAALDHVRGVASVVAHAAIDAALAEHGSSHLGRDPHLLEACLDLEARRAMWHEALLAAMAETVRKALADPVRFGIRRCLYAVSGRSSWPDQDSCWSAFEPRWGDGMASCATILAVASGDGVSIALDVKPPCTRGWFMPRLLGWPSLTPWTQGVTKAFAGKLKAWGWSDHLAKERALAFRTGMAHAMPWIDHERARVEAAKAKLVRVHKCQGCGAWTNGGLVERHEVAGVMCLSCREIADELEAEGTPVR